MNLVLDAQRIYKAALDAVQPETLIKRIFEFKNDGFTIRFPAGGEQTFSYSDYSKIHVFAIGKAGPEVARHLEIGLRDHISFGMAISPEYAMLKLRRVLCMEGEHPLPGPKALHSSKFLLEQLKRVELDDLVIFVVTGGGSSCFEVFTDTLSLDEVRKTYDLLLRRGIPVEEINQVRCALSEVKGGKALQYCKPKQWINVILSDVMSDNLARVASGPTIPQSYDAKDIITKRRLELYLPEKVRAIIDGVFGKYVTHEPQFPLLNLVLGGPNQCMEAAKAKAIQIGYSVRETLRLGGEAAVAGRNFLEQTFKLQPKECLLASGETVVNLPKKTGLGGRNMEFVLSAAARAQEQSGWPENWVVFSAGTDGKDGPTDAAGAYVNSEAIDKCRALHLDAKLSLQAHDSYNYFSKCGALIRTGVTGTNALDLAIGLRGEGIAPPLVE